MSLPTSADLETYTGGRLVDGDDNTDMFLASAIATARAYCGWPVTPVQTVTITVDGPGPGRPVLMLPTLNLVALTTVIEDGITLDVTTLEWSSIGQVRKKSALTSIWPLRHGWSSHYGAITVTMTHGFMDVPDWNMAVLSLADQMTLNVGPGGTSDLIENTVDDVTQRWSDKASVSVVGGGYLSVLNKYRLVPMA